MLDEARWLSRAAASCALQALLAFGITPSCKTAWGHVAAWRRTAPGNDAAPPHDHGLSALEVKRMRAESWSVASVASFVRSPTASDTMLTRTATDAQICRAFGDAPWLYVFPWHRHRSNPGPSAHALG